MIPAAAKVLINTRWFEPEVLEMLFKRIDEVSKGVAISAGVPANKMPTTERKGNAGPLVNDPKLVDQINPSLTALLGEGK